MFNFPKISRVEKSGAVGVDGGNGSGLSSGTQLRSNVSAAAFSSFTSNDLHLLYAMAGPKETPLLAVSPLLQ